MFKNYFKILIIKNYYKILIIKIFVAPLTSSAADVEMKRRKAGNVHQITQQIPICVILIKMCAVMANSGWDIEKVVPEKRLNFILPLIFKFSRNEHACNA